MVRADYVPATLGPVDYGVLVAYFACVVGLGAWVARGQSTLREYFLASRRMNWVIVCASIVATDLSAVSYMGVPAWILGHDLKYNTGILLLPLVMVVVVVLFVRVFHRMGVFTVYEYLEARFHPAVRAAAAGLFLMQRGAWLASAIYVPSLALASVTDFNVVVSILLVGMLATLYTVLGGIRAVIWTDFVQFIVLCGGLVVMIVVLMSSVGWDAAAVWRQAATLTAPATGTPHTRLIDWSFDFRTEATVWALLFYYFIYNVGSFGTDQVTVQRYLTVGSFRDMAKSVIGSGLVTVVLVAALVWLGLLLVVYYHQRPELAASLSRPDAIVPHFVVHALPVGLRGLIVAAIMAATMSSVDSALNSFATVGVMDLYLRFKPDRHRDQRRLVWISRMLTLAAGLSATLAAVWISTRQTTIIETVGSLMSKFIGPITGMFFLGVLTRRVGLAAVLAGGLAGLVVGLGVDWGPVKQNVNWMWTAPLGCLATLLVGCALAWITPDARSRFPIPAQDGSEP